MDADYRVWGITCAQHFAGVACYANGASKQRLGGSRAEQDDCVRADGLEFGLKPRLARDDLGHSRCLMDATLAFPKELKVFDGVGDVDLFAWYGSHAKRA